MAFVNIKAKLKTKLQSISSIQEVVDYPTEEFNGFPAAVVKPARLESQYETTSENKRTYVFTIFILDLIKGNDISGAINVVEETIDDVIESFDQDQLLSGISLPSNETMIITFPVVSDVYNSDKYAVGALDIKVIVSFSIN